MSFGTQPRRRNNHAPIHMAFDATSAHDFRTVDDIWTPARSFRRNTRCLQLQESTVRQYPKFETERFLENGIQNQFYQTSATTLAVDTGTQVQASYFEGNLPDAVTVTVQTTLSNPSFLLRGRFTDAGSYSLVLKLEDNFGNLNFKQFQYCVQTQLDNCPAGTYYEPSVNQCVQYPAPSPQRSLVHPGTPSTHTFLRASSMKFRAALSTIDGMTSTIAAHANLTLVREATNTIGTRWSAYIFGPRLVLGMSAGS